MQTNGMERLLKSTSDDSYEKREVGSWVSSRERVMSSRDRASHARRFTFTGYSSPSHGNQRAARRSLSTARSALVIQPCAVATTFRVPLYPLGLEEVEWIAHKGRVDSTKAGVLLAAGGGHLRPHKLGSGMASPRIYTPA